MVRLSAFFHPAAVALLAGVANGYDQGHHHPTTSLSASPTTNPSPPGPIVVPPPPPPDKIFSYPQPALPQRTAARDPSNWKLDKHKKDRHHGDKTRRYDFNLSYAAGAPSGFHRRLTTANAQFPGPLIQANVGDTIEVKITNDLDEPQALHWHGIRMEGTPYNDGPPGINQCPIPPGGSYTYRFKVSTFGTYWWHSHYGATMADGLYGAIVVHSPEDPIKSDAGEVLFVSDWYDDQSTTIVAGLRDTKVGYRGMPIPGIPDAVLINGLGQTNCSHVQPGVECTQNEAHVVEARPGSKLRLRLINPGMEAMIRFSVDGHVLQVVEADDTPIEPLHMHELDIAPGQRYSVILDLDQPGAAYWMRARIAAACVLLGRGLETKAVLRYTGREGEPTSEPWPDRADSTAPCVDIDNKYTVVPLQREKLLKPVACGRLDSAAGEFLDIATGAKFIGFGFNNVTYVNYIQDPVYQQVQEGRPLNTTHFAHLSFSGEGSADLLLNQLDAGIAHPFHLHGRPFSIIARGSGNMTLEGLKDVELNTTNPLRRDTLHLPVSSWALLRIPLDDPGVWAIHCHLGWHLANGKLAVIVVQPEKLKHLRQPREWYGLCTGDKAEIGPAKRDSDVSDEARPAGETGEAGEGDDYTPPQARRYGETRTG